MPPAIHGQSQLTFPNILQHGGESDSEPVVLDEATRLSPTPTVTAATADVLAKDDDAKKELYRNDEDDNMKGFVVASVVVDSDLIAFGVLLLINVNAHAFATKTNKIKIWGSKRQMLSLLILILPLLA